MSLFLPREPNNIDSGPLTFGGTDILNTAFYFRPAPPVLDAPGLLNSVFVSNAGWNNLNGVFTYTTIFQNKPYYNKDGNADWFIVWFNNRWDIYDFSENPIDPIYYSNQDTLYPWNVTNWTAINPIYNPVPSVVKVP